MQIQCVVESKSENPPKGDRTFTRYIVNLRTSYGGLIELIFDTKEESDAYVIGETRSINLG